MHRAVDEIGGDPAIRVVVITGEGESFCAGADIKSTPDDSSDTSGTATGTLLGRVQGQIATSFVAQELMAGLFEKIHRLKFDLTRRRHNLCGFTFN